MPTILESARVTFGRGDDAHRGRAADIFAGHVKVERTTIALDPDHEHERRKPYDRLMRQPPRPR